MTGWRIGYILAPRTICENILKVHQYNVTCAPIISQYAAIEALSNNSSDIKVMRDELLKRGDHVYNRLIKMNLETPLQDGAF